MTNKELYLHIELYKDLQYEIKTIKENVNSIKLFLHDMKDGTIKKIRYIGKYCDQEKDLMQLLEKKNELLNEVREYLFENCKHEWTKDFSESCLYTNVTIHPYKTCNNCGIMKAL